MRRRDNQPPRAPAGPRGPNWPNPLLSLLMSLAPHPQPVTPATLPSELPSAAVAIRGLSKTYRGRHGEARQALIDIDLEIPRGVPPGRYAVTLNAVGQAPRAGGGSRRETYPTNSFLLTVTAPP